jgi:hypothetical protein
MRDDDTISHIFDIIKRIKNNFSLIKALIQKSISNGQFWTAPLVDVTYREESEHKMVIDGAILVGTKVLQDSKPAAKPSNKEKRLEAQHHVWEWAESKSKKK